jgi:hypothetical protein
VRNWATARVCRNAHHADRAEVYIDAVRLHENGIACGNVERSGTGTAAENEKPSLSFGFPQSLEQLREISVLDLDFSLDAATVISAESTVSAGCQLLRLGTN